MPAMEEKAEIKGILGCNICEIFYDNANNINNFLSVWGYPNNIGSQSQLKGI